MRWQITRRTLSYRVFQPEGFSVVSGNPSTHVSYPCTQAVFTQPCNTAAAAAVSLWRAFARPRGGRRMHWVSHEERCTHSSLSANVLRHILQWRVPISAVRNYWRVWCIAVPLIAWPAQRDGEGNVHSALQPAPFLSCIINHKVYISLVSLSWRKVCLPKSLQKESLEAQKMIGHNYRIPEGLSASLSYQRHQQDLQRFSFPLHTDQSWRRGQGSVNTAQYSEWDLCAKLLSRPPQRFLLCHLNCLHKR